MDRLRSKGGCPWDRQQTLDSLKQYLVEECYEVIDAIDSENIARHEEELGDLLLQVVFQSRIRQEQGLFTFDDVVGHICDKLVRRHPHVFGDVRVSGPDEVLKNWDTIKASEKANRHQDSKPVEPRSAVEGIARHLPALYKAHQIQTRAARVGFDWDKVHEVIDKIGEELTEVQKAIASGDSHQVKEEIGDLLFAVVNLSRFQAINAEEALNRSIDKFVCRFRKMEKRVRADGRELSQCTLAEMDMYWNAVKEEEIL